MSLGMNNNGGGGGGGGNGGSYGNIGGGAISSNAYANGANQNCGNVMTGRSSTRIHAPPGGGSQISFGGYGDAANNLGGASGAISSNAYANGANQNCGNFMTGRSSTRLHA